MRNIKKRSRGFSLLEIMLALGVLGMLSVGTMKMMKTGQAGAKQLESRIEATQLQNLASTVLRDKDACFSTFQNAKVGESVLSIKTSTGQVFWSASQGEIGESNVKFKEIKLINVGASVSAKLKKVDATIVFERIKSTTTGGQFINIDLPFIMELDASNNVVECYTDAHSTIQAAEDQAMEAICVGELGGTWNPTLKTCAPTLSEILDAKLDVTGTKTLTINNPTAITTTGSVSTGALTSTTVKASSVTTSGTIQGTTITATTSLKSNGSVTAGAISSTGTLTASGVSANSLTASNLTVSETLSVKSLKLPSCPTGQVWVTKSDGTMYCLTKPTCDTGEFVQGYNSDGSPVCVSLFANDTAKDCDAGVQLTTDTDGSLKLICPEPVCLKGEDFCKGVVYPGEYGGICYGTYEDPAISYINRTTTTACSTSRTTYIDTEYLKDQALFKCSSPVTTKTYTNPCYTESVDGKTAGPGGIAFTSCSGSISFGTTYSCGSPRVSCVTKYVCSGDWENQTCSNKTTCTSHCLSGYTLTGGMCCKTSTTSLYHCSIPAPMPTATPVPASDGGDGGS